ncbi:rCG58234, isoform CRA_b [Rattus norvegicus]|uniref:RCG58234, isoform CRA_b n=1 Tax=Rattus norvegicus TaxID=10116 RepID=A6J518_RAT|nr:rCG58234, isoform CRA_b [Rattus norvegicus]
MSCAIVAEAEMKGTDTPLSGHLLLKEAGLDILQGSRINFSLA